MAAKGLSIGLMIDSIWGLREKRRLLDAQSEAIKSEIDLLETDLLARMQTENMDKATGKKGSVFITENTTGSIKDMDAFCKYVKKTGHFHLFQRRISDPAMREILERGGKIPGVDVFTKRKINLRTVGDQ